MSNESSIMTSNSIKQSPGNPSKSTSIEVKIEQLLEN